MTTLNEMTAIIKAENPTIQVGDEEQGYTELTSAQYDAQVAEWAEGRLDKEAKAEAKAQAAADVEALLVKLGITADEAALLLGGTN